MAIRNGVQAVSFARRIAELFLEADAGSVEEQYLGDALEAAADRVGLTKLFLVELVKDAIKGADSL